MSSQLLGANASLNAPGGVPGAAPFVTQGGIVAGSNSSVNGTFTVTNTSGGVTPSGKFTNGLAPPLLQEINILNGLNSTILQFRDSGNGGNILFEGTVAPAGGFICTSPFAITSAADVVPQGTLSVVNGSAGASPTASFSNGLTGAALQGINIINGLSSTILQFRDSSQGGNIIFEGTDGPLGRFQMTSDVGFLSATQSGRTVAGPSGSGTNAVAIAGLTAAGVVIVTPVVGTPATVGSFSVTVNAGSFDIFFSGAGPVAFNWFIAKY